MYWPLVNTLQLSFLQWNLLPNIPQRPVGMANYASVLTLPEMGRAALNTAIYILGLLPFSVVLPLAIAILISDIGGRWRSAYRAILFLPVLVAPIVVGVVWRWLLHPTAGVLNLALSGLFGNEPIAFFRDPTLAIWAIVGITAWELLGFSVLIFSAGLTNINREYLEAAQLDGASAWQSAWFVTLPLLSADSAVHGAADGDPLRAVDLPPDQRAHAGWSAERDDQRLLPAVGVRVPQLQRRVQLRGGGAIFPRIWPGSVDFQLVD